MICQAASCEHYWESVVKDACYKLIPIKQPFPKKERGHWSPQGGLHKLPIRNILYLVNIVIVLLFFLVNFAFFLFFSLAFSPFFSFLSNIFFHFLCSPTFVPQFFFSSSPIFLINGFSLCFFLPISCTVCFI